jgi:hypothetical protein
MIRVSEEEECPTEDFTPGVPAGTCWGDGHYKCNDCVLFRADFKADHSLRDKILSGQGGMRFYTLSDNNRLIRFA